MLAKSQAVKHDTTRSLHAAPVASQVRDWCMKCMRHFRFWSLITATLQDEPLTIAACAMCVGLHSSMLPSEERLLLQPMHLDRLCLIRRITPPSTRPFCRPTSWAEKRIIPAAQPYHTMQSICLPKSMSNSWSPSLQ